MSTKPSIHAGPILKRLTSTDMVLWYVVDRDCQANLQVYLDGENAEATTLTSEKHQFKVGEHAYIVTLQASFKKPLPELCRFNYDLVLESDGQSWDLATLIPDLCYDYESKPTVVLKSKLDKILHGSCRKPHHTERDALTQIEQILQHHPDDEEIPSLLLMTGDQVYVDDVAGPMLTRIQHVIKQIGLFQGTVPGSIIKNAADLPDHPYNFYKRDKLLPYLEENEEVEETFFKAKKKPIFTSINAANHLITLSEVLAMYFLVWSPELWQEAAKKPDSLSEEEQSHYDREEILIQEFAEDLAAVRRVLAHIPTYMIFDDHDVTDDWNLTRGWEEAAYGNAFSKRIIGNALIGYFLCQGFANEPGQFKELVEQVQHCFQPDHIADHDALVDAMLRWSHWHYCLPTSPKILVMDTRTHRWRSEDDPDKPSGLMDYETLKDLEQQLVGEDNVILVSAAPMFGVKLIEAIQRIFTFFGHALTVDAENWMAHPGTAKVLLDIFRHSKTPSRFIILSGDVHYSFAYDITIRFKECSPQLHQITASGIKNQFPPGLIKWLDRLNRGLYGRMSPLNWFTKRRRMRIDVRDPQPYRKGATLVSRSGIGVVELDDKGGAPTAKLLTHDNQEIVFEKTHTSSMES